MTAYELEGLRISEVLCFPFLELNKDLHCSKRNKPWISSRALIHIRIEILKHASVTFSINYWVSKWWWFVIFPSSLLTIACFPPKNYVPDLKQRGRRLNTAKQLSDFTVVRAFGKQSFSHWSLCQQQHKKWWHLSVPQVTAVPEQGVPTGKLGNRAGMKQVQSLYHDLASRWRFLNTDATQCHDGVLPITNHTDLSQTGDSQQHLPTASALLLQKDYRWDHREDKFGYNVGFRN